MSGLGLVIGSLAFGLFGNYLDKYIGKSPRIIFAFVLHIISFLITFINVPFDSTFGYSNCESFVPIWIEIIIHLFRETSEDAIIDPNAGLAMLVSFLVGIADACYNTQIYVILGSLYRENSAPAFAVYSFAQSGFSAISFVYSSYLSLNWQLLVLAIFSVMGTISFVIVDRISIQKVYPKDTKW